MIIVELLDPRGAVKQRLRVSDDVDVFTIGRSLSNAVILEDPGVAHEHARIHVSGDGSYEIENLAAEAVVGPGGTRLGEGGRARFDASEVVQIGDTRLRLSRPPAEAAAIPATGGRIFGDFEPGVLPTVGLGFASLGLILLVVYQGWYGPDFAYGVIGIALGLPLFLGFWAGVWAIGNRIFCDRSHFRAHFTIAAGTVLVVGIGSRLSAWLGFAYPGWFTDWVIGSLLTIVPAIIAFLAHVDVSSRRSPKFKAIVTGAVTAVFAGLAVLGTVANVSSADVRGALGPIEPLPVAIIGKKSSDHFADELKEIEDDIAVDPAADD